MSFERGIGFYNFTAPLLDFIREELLHAVNHSYVAHPVLGGDQIPQVSFAFGQQYFLHLKLPRIFQNLGHPTSFLPFLSLPGQWDCLAEKLLLVGGFLRILRWHHIWGAPRLSAGSASPQVSHVCSVPFRLSFLKEPFTGTQVTGFLARAEKSTREGRAAQKKEEFQQSRPRELVWEENF